MLEQLDLEKTAENEDTYNKAMEQVREFVRAAIEAKSPVAGTIIQKTFKLAVEMEVSDFITKRFLFVDVAEQLRSQLFLASDCSSSKIGNVVKDLVDDGVQFKLNDFTVMLLRMLTADSVNILKNVKDVELKEDVGKAKQPWTAVLQNHDMFAGDTGDQQHIDWGKLENSYKGKILPRIVEIGFHQTSYVLGIYVAYSDGTTYSAKGSSNDASTYVSLKMRKGEYIKSITGRQGAWTD